MNIPAKRRLRCAALASLALTAGLLGSACSSSGGPEAIADTRPAAATSTSVPSPDQGPTTTQAASSPTRSTAPTAVVRADHDLTAFERPDATSPQRTLSGATEFGSALALLVTSQNEPGWVQVLVPGRPTGATAWLPLDGASFELRTITTHLQVDLAARTLTLFDNGEVVLSTPVAIGSPDAPTPTGVFSVTDKLQDPSPNGAYGPFALGLSGRSEVLTDFAGGDGQIGIHGTNDPSSIGQDVSHGCIRVPNDVIIQLNDLLPLGTPVVVR